MKRLMLRLALRARKAAALGQNSIQQTNEGLRGSGCAGRRSGERTGEGSGQRPGQRGGRMRGLGGNVQGNGFRAAARAGKLEMSDPFVIDREPETARRIERVRYEIKRRQPTVVAVEYPTSGFVRIHLQGEDMKDFDSRSFDDHIKVFVPVEGSEPVARDYTPLAFDPAGGRLTLEFARHAGGVASEWASQLKPGDKVNLGGPKGSMIIPMDYDWHLLIGDPTSLPAIERRLRELPPAARVTAIIQVNDVCDQRSFETRSSADVHWVQNYDELISVVEALPLPTGEGFVWAGLEGNTVKRLREILLETKGHPKEHAKLSSYWKVGASGFSEKG